MIYVVGSSNTDMVVRSERLPAPGETIIGGSFLMNPGGKGANQAVAASRLGGAVTFICKVGNDLFGQEALAHFQREGLHTEFVVVDRELPSGVALINVDAAGENSITVAPGANNALNTREVATGLKALSERDILLVQLEIHPEVVDAALQVARERGARAVLNPAPARMLPEHTYNDLFMITPNQTEAALLTGLPVTSDDEVRRAAQQLFGRGCRHVVITLGSRGVFLKTADLEVFIPAPAVTAVDSTAAGDCFNGALVVGVAEGMPLQEAITWACKAAAISVTRPGAQSSLPYRKEIVMS